ncbi:MAG: trigger factor [Bacteroidales bacterium]|nr:trigger factor [Bacteroidales bacterium]
MNISRENLSDLDLLIKVEIGESDYAEEVKKQLKNYKNKATVPGFRKGMAPMGLIERMYKGAIVADAVQNKLTSSLYDYLENEKLDILGSPLSNDEKTGTIDFENNKDFTFYFDAALMPKVELAWDKVDAKLYQVKVNPKDIDKRVDDIAKRFGKFETPETVGDNDFVYGKVEELDKEGNVKEGGVSTFTSFDLSNLKNHDEIFPLFEGKKAEDKVVFNAAKAFTASDIETNFRIDAAAAKKFKSDVQLTLSGISRTTPHEVNDELFKKVFPNDEVKDLAAFRKLVSKDIEKQYNEQCEIFFVNEVHKQLLDNFTAEMPEAFLKRWILSREEKEMTMETLEEQWADKYVPSLRWEMVDSALNKIKKLEPSQRDVLDYIKNILREGDVKQEGEDDKAQDARLEQAAQSIAKERQNVQNIIDRIYSHNSFLLYNEQLKPEAEKITIKEFGEKIKG